MKIVYFIDGDENPSYVSENGNIVEFVQDSVSSVVNTTVGNKIAFISKEGYIGVYRYGGDSITKIWLPQGEINPLAIKFTPDGNNIIAMCADGKFIKYNIEGGEKVGEYKSETDISTSSMFEFMDNSTFYIKKYNLSDQIVVVDIDSMQKLAEIEDFVDYMSSERKIVYRRYTTNGQYETGYYNYLTTEELIELANIFLKNK